MSLATHVSSLLDRPLTAEEMDSLAKFQRDYEIDDSDPLIVVLALMAKSHVITESLPNLLQQKSIELIELHRQTLREQSTLIAKELITTLAQNLEAANVDWKSRWLRYFGCFITGAVMAAVIMRGIH